MIGPRSIDRRTTLTGLLTLPILLEGCPGKAPPPSTMPVPPSETGDVPEDAAYRFDFGGEFQSIP